MAASHRPQPRRAGGGGLPPSSLAAVALAAALALPRLAAGGRVERLVNDEWRFHRGDLPGYVCSTPESAAVFPIDLSGTAVRELADAPGGVASAAACAATCASNCSCQVWQWCSAQIAPGICGDSPPPRSGAAALPPPAAAVRAGASASSNCSFPADLDNVQCDGLSQVPSATDEAACAAACCADETCEVYQFCPSSGGGSCGPSNSCWVGAVGQCNASPGWLSRARNVTLGAACQTGLLADYGPGTWQTAGTGGWTARARLAPPAPPAQPSGPAAPGYDDSAWEQHVQLPHDYLAPVAPTNVNSTYHQSEHGSIPFSNAWYRRTVNIPAGTTLARLFFAGAYRSAAVFLNGALAAQHEEGYTGFSVWLHNVSGAPLRTGAGAAGDNLVAVYLAATTYTYELWGYEGEGITRDVTLVLHDAEASIAPWGVFARSALAGAVTAPDGPCGAQRAPAVVSPSVDVANADASAAVRVIVTATVYAPAGGGVAGASSTPPVALAPGGWARLAPPPIPLAAALLWAPACSPDAPPRPLYTLETALVDADTGARLDAVNTTFGVRNATFSPDEGVLVNGFATKVRGFSMHGDFAGTGTFVPPNVQRYRVRRLQEIGGNAWRTAHNPPDPALLDACDAAGMLVWLETRFLRDFDVYQADALDMVLQHRNRPSVIIYSLCNENGCGESAGWEGGAAGVMPGAALATAYMAAMRAADDTRPISGNGHYTLGSAGSIQSVVDVMALTYDYSDLAKLRAGRPGVPVMNGESASCQSDRSDVDVTGALGCTRDSWATADANAWDAGAFVWSGHDYRCALSAAPRRRAVALLSSRHSVRVTRLASLGARRSACVAPHASPFSHAPPPPAPSPPPPPPRARRGECGGWPNTVSFYGALDLCGFDKGIAFWYKVWWGAAAGWPATGDAAVGAWPPWAPPPAGGPVVIAAASSVAAALQLSVNGAAVGGPVPTGGRLAFSSWSVPFAAGSYTVTALAANGTALGSYTSTSPGAAVALTAVVDWPGSGPGGALLAGRRDAALLAVAVVDAAGVVVRGARANVTLTLAGPGELIGLGNGDHANHLPGAGLAAFPTYDGRLRAVLRGAAAATGAPLRVAVDALGLRGAVVELNVV